MAQTIWLHKLAEAKKAEADGMDYICEHPFQASAQTGKLTKAKGWNPFQEATSKDGTPYRAHVCAEYPKRPTES
jgi:thiamine monophosphate synthase